MNALTNRICQQNKRRILNILIISILYLLFPVQKVFSTEPGLRNKVHTVVIDAGHGGKDPGAVGSRIKEKEVVLSIALKLGKYIEQNFEDVEVIYTRKTDVFIPLDERAEIANKAKADLFISIHANALPNTPAVGTETFVMGVNKDTRNFDVAKKENSVILLEDNYETKYQGFNPKSIDSYIIFSVMQKTYQGHSLAFAQMVQNEFEQRAKRINRGVKQNGFWVLWRTTMPSVLIETGFLTHHEEEKYLASLQGQEYLASAIFRAFRKYKNTIEKNSNFDSLGVGSTTKPEASPPTDQHQEILDPNVYFKIQVMVAGKALNDAEKYFEDYSEVKMIKSGNWYKYSVGKSTSYKEIETYCDYVRKKHPDAFIIAFQNEKVISIKEALKLLNDWSDDKN